MTATEFNLGLRERFITVNETSYGTGGSLASALVIGKNMRVTQSWAQGFQETLSAGNDRRYIDANVAGPLLLPYNIEFYPVDWRFLKYAFDITSETGSTPTTHTLDVGNTLQSFRAEWAKQNSQGNQAFITTGNVVTQMVISFQKATGAGNDGFVNVNLGVLAQDYSSTSSVQGSISSLTDDPFQYRMVKLTLASNEIVEVNNGEMTIQQTINPNDSRYANSTLNRKIGEPIPTVFRIFGRFNINVKDTTYSDIWELAADLTGTNKLEFIRTSGSDEAVWTFTGMTVNPASIGNTNIEGVDNVEFVWVAETVQVVTKDAIANYD